MTAYGPPNQPGPPGPPPGGYGPPPGPQGPGGSAATRRVASVNPLDWAVLGAGLLALIFSFFSFYTYDPKGQLATVCKAGRGTSTAAGAICGGTSESAWHGFFGWAGVLLIVLGALAVAMAVFSPQTSLPVSVRLIGAGLAALGTVLVLVALFVTPEWSVAAAGGASDSDYNKFVSDGAGFSLYIVLILGLVVTALSFLRFQQTGGALPGRSGAGTSAPAGPAAGSYGSVPGAAAQPPYPGQQYPPQGPPAQQYPPQGPPAQQYPPQGPPAQQYPPQGPPAQQYPPQGPPAQQYPPQGPPAQQYPPQGPPAQDRPGDAGQPGHGEQPDYGQQPPPQGYQPPPQGYQPPPERS